MKQYKLTKEQKKTVTIIGINATENCTCGYADFTEKSYKDSCELLAKELHLQKEEIKQIIIADDEEFVSEDVRQARNRMKESIINKL